MAEKITAAQRKYFDNRIESALNDKISSLKQQDASNVHVISSAAFTKYLNLIGIKKDLDRYRVVNQTHKELQTKLHDVYSEIRRSMNIDQFNGNAPHVYEGSDYEAYEKGYKYLCQKAALKAEGITPMGKEISRLKEQMNSAKDVLYGVNELPELLKCVNGILKEAEVPLLGDGKDE